MIWKFASPPPETGTEYQIEGGEIAVLAPILETECPALKRGDTNGDLFTFYVNCRARFLEVLSRLELYDSWVAIEREAHERLQGVGDGNR